MRKPKERWLYRIKGKDLWLGEFKSEQALHTYCQTKLKLKIGEYDTCCEF
jgi:hypothetical protein